MAARTQRGSDESVVVSPTMAVHSVCEAPPAGLFAHLNDFKNKHPLSDPGNHPSEHFKRHMSRFRYRMREWLVPYTANQSEPLHRWQTRVRTPALDKYFAYTALMGSHMFYVVVLPMPRWLGHSVVTRDLVYVLGHSIYLSGFLKDYWCLPRPGSPPLHRITLSKYTAREYGAPSSHTANATAVSLLLAFYIWQSGQSVAVKAVCLVLAAAYYVTLVVGRVYCGMHGLLDIVSGSVIGLVCFAVRLVAREWLDFDRLSVQEWGRWFPAASCTFGLATLFLHARPVDQCPCFEDSVAFMGVIFGVESGDWLFPRVYGGVDYQIPFSWAQLGLGGSLLRVISGVAMVILWKNVASKPLIYSVLKLVMSDDRDPVRDKQLEELGRVEVPLHQHTPRIDIMGRFFIYAGISAIVVLVCPLVFSRLGIYE